MENDSKDSNDTILYVNTLFASVYGLNVAVGLPLNSILLWVFSIKLKLQTAPVIYMTNLAASDLLFILLLPFRVYYFATTRWPFGNLVCTMSETIFSVNIYTSTLLITLISIDRYLAVVHPLKSNFLRSPKAAKIACAIAWIIIILINFPIAFQYHQKDTKNGTKCYEGFSTENWQFALRLILLITTVGFAVPFVIIIGCFFAVVRVMFRIRKESQAFKRYKIIPLFLLNTGVFVVCFLPFNVALVSYGLHKVGYFSMDGSYLVHAVTMCLASISSCIDPIVYYFISKAFRNVAMKDAKDTSLCNSFKKRGHQTNKENLILGT